MKLSVLLPVMPLDVRAAMPFAAMVKHSNAHSLWQGQGLLLDSYQLFTALSAAGVGVPMGSGVALIPLRNPLEAAVQINSLMALSKQPMVAGFGPGAKTFQTSVMGRPYASPLTAMREYLNIVRELLTGQAVSQEGQYFTLQAQLPPIHTQIAELGLGVLRPKMAALAGEVADVAITWMCPPSYIAEVLRPGLQAAAESAGRPAPRIVAIVPVARETPGRDHKKILWTGSQVHLGAPHYQDMLARAGIDVRTGSPETSTAQLLAGEVFLGGSLDRIGEGLQSYRAAGVDEVVLNTTGIASVSADEALEELATVLTEVTP